MAQLFRWLTRIFGAIFALILLGSGVVYYLAARSLPDYDAAHGVPDISAPVEIVRNNAGVPHVFGQNDLDSFYGLGFAHAQDRLWQMVLLRRTAQGRLSELFGERTLATDDILRRLGIYQLALQSAEAQTPETSAVLQAYADGVNAWLRLVHTEALGRGAPEFFLFPSDIQPWQPADSIALIKLMALRLSPHMEEEVLRARLSLVLDGGTTH